MSSPVAITEDQARARARARKVQWIAAAVAVVVTALIIALATRPEASSKVSQNPLIGEEAPNFQGIALDGRKVNLADMRGRYVIVNFFATWCGPCRQEHPEMKAFAETHTQPLQPTFIAVAYDKNDVSNARSFFAQYGGTWPVLPDDGSRIAVDYGVRGLPESFVVDPHGNITARITGALTQEQIKTLTSS